MKSKENEVKYRRDAHKVRNPPSEASPIYAKLFDDEKISVHPFLATAHLSIMHDWASKPYSSRFWQMNMSFREFKADYLTLIDSGNCFVVLLSVEDVFIAQLDIYQVSKDALSAHVKSTPDDYGIHLLMAPYRDLIPRLGDQTRDLAKNCLITVLEMLFYASGASNVYAEPDSRNKHACNLAEQVGFNFLKTVDIEAKKANLYQISKTSFESRYGPPDWTNTSLNRNMIP